MNIIKESIDNASEGLVEVGQKIAVFNVKSFLFLD